MLLDKRQHACRTGTRGVISVSTCNNNIHKCLRVLRVDGRQGRGKESGNLLAQTGIE